jgi:LacI family transcriptional regulator
VPGPTELDTFALRGKAFTAAAIRLGAEVVEINSPASASTFEEGQRLMGYLLSQAMPRPTAVFAHNDPMALGALDVLRRSGIRCPEEMSVVGYNDNPFTDQTNPPLTTVRIHSYEIGLEAARMAMELLEDGAVEDISIPPELVIRDSAARYSAPA